MNRTGRRFGGRPVGDLTGYLFGWQRLRTPLIPQLEAAECGAASLGIVLAHFGRWVPIEELRIACGVNRDGANAASIVRAGERYGLRIRGWSREVDDLRDLDLPAILLQMPSQRRWFAAERRLTGDLLQFINGTGKLRGTGAEPSAFAAWARHYREQHLAGIQIGRLNEHLLAFSSALPALVGVALFTVALGAEPTIWQSATF